MKITFLNALENVQQLSTQHFGSLAKLSYDLKTHSSYGLTCNTNAAQDTQVQSRQEVLNTGVTNPTAEILNSTPYPTSVLYELFRLYPPVSQLISCAKTGWAVLGCNIVIPSLHGSIGIRMACMWMPEIGDQKP
jgi:hypothetical protein